jgi:hypothetical protein
MLTIIFEVIFYDGEGYAIFLTSLFPIFGMVHTLAVSLEYRLSIPYRVYNKKEHYVLIFDMVKFLAMFIAVLWDTEMWFVLGVIVSIGLKVSLNMAEKNKLRFYSYFSDIMNICFDGVLLLTSLEWAEFLTWGPILILLGTISIFSEIYIIFLYVTAGHDFFNEADKISIISVFTLSVMTVIIGGIISNFEIHLRLKGVFLFVLIIQLLIMIGLGIYNYIFKDLKPTHIKINLKKKMVKPVVHYSEITSSSGSSNEKALTLRKKLNSDSRSYFKTIR